MCNVYLQSGNYNHDWLTAVTVYTLIAYLLALMVRRIVELTLLLFGYCTRDILQGTNTGAGKNKFDCFDIGCRNICVRPVCVTTRGGRSLCDIPKRIPDDDDNSHRTLLLHPSRYILNSHLYTIETENDSSQVIALGPSEIYAYTFCFWLDPYKNIHAPTHTHPAILFSKMYLLCI